MRRIPGFPRRSQRGGVELAEGVILHTAGKNEITGIEILDASKKFPINGLGPKTAAEAKMLAKGWKMSFILSRNPQHGLP